MSCYRAACGSVERCSGLLALPSFERHKVENTGAEYIASSEEQDKRREKAKMEKKIEGRKSRQQSGPRLE